MTAWFHCNNETGAILAAGMTSTVEEAQLQQPADGYSLVITPDGMVLNPFNPEPDFTNLRAWLVNTVDAEAEQVRSQFATPGSGQAMEYQEAVAQALALTAGKAGPFPMLAADVAAGTVDPRTSETITSEEGAADLILWMHGQWIAVGSAVRAARLSAKVAINTGTTLPAIVEAAQVDWSSILPNGAP